MTHRYHPDPAMGDHPDAIVFDGCAECEARADLGIQGLVYYDRETFDRLWNRMLDVEKDDLEGHRNKTEQKLCRSLYCMALLMGRYMPGSTPWERRGTA